jgi:endonuclease/exonuclease/phosphatase family metal-dependent hydrolase
VGLQECWSLHGHSQADALAAALGMHAAFVEVGLPPAPDPVEYAEQQDVVMGLGLISRWPIIEVVSHPMPSEDRHLVALLATIDHPDAPLHVIVGATSWEPERLRETAAQLAALRDLALDPALDGPLPVILLADLNYDFENPAMADLREHLVDSWGVANDAEADPRTLSDTNRFAPPEAELQYNRRIDHVMFRAGSREVTVARSWIVRDEVDGFPPSDHYPVVSDLQL